VVEHLDGGRNPIGGKSFERYLGQFIGVGKRAKKGQIDDNCGGDEKENLVPQAELDKGKMQKEGVPRCWKGALSLERVNKNETRRR